MLSIIAAIGKNNEIGQANKLLWHLPADMKFFREKTSGHTVVMGRKTFESIGRPLPNRRNIVITREEGYTKEGIEVFNSIHSVLDCVRQDLTQVETFIIGGAEIYKSCMPYAEKLYITHVNAEFAEADTFFPAIDPTVWHKTKSTLCPKDTENAYDMEFAEYERKV
jgi:dihydrofolate reductase